MRATLYPKAAALLAAVLLGLAAGEPASADPRSAAAPAAPTRPFGAARAETAERAGAVIPGRYIVRFRGDRGVAAAATALTAEGVRVVETYRHALRGAAVSAGPAAARALRSDPRVRSVEPDRVVTTADAGGGGTVTAAATQTRATWGLDRSDQRPRRLSGSYSYPAKGTGVTVYVVDTGIRADHEQFGGRVGRGYTAIRDGRGTRDCNGHGTHVAGTVGGARHGMAKSVSLVPVRVLGCDGAGTLSGILAGLDWIVNHHPPGAPAVANLSLGMSGVSPQADAALRAVIADGVTAVAAAGNATVDACSTSPARVPAAVTVGATTAGDARAYFSNYGPCLDLFAPGFDIKSAWHTSRTATNTSSGTSMAAPHVAGAAAVLLSQRPKWTPADVGAALVYQATRGVVSGRGPGSPDRLLYASPAGPPAPPSNDGFSYAASVPLTGAGALDGRNVAATRQAGEPDHGDLPGGRSVWWRFTPAAAGTVTLSTQGSDFDTLLAVYTGGSVSTLTQVAANDDSPGGTWSSLPLQVKAGVTYRVAVDGYAGASGSVRLRYAWAPPNDAFSAARSLSLTGASPVAGTNVRATLEVGEPPHAGPGGRSVWWRFTAPSSGTVTLSTQGSSFDTLLAVYTGASVGALTQLAADDDHGGTLQSLVTVPVTAGTVYRVAVDGHTGESGAIKLSFSGP